METQSKWCGLLPSPSCGTSGIFRPTVIINSFINPPKHYAHHFDHMSTQGTKNYIPGCLYYTSHRRRDQAPLLRRALEDESPFQRKNIESLLLKS